MAEKTEFLQAIDDAILDADSLEQFINGDDSETVLTRLSAEYPTLQKAIKQMFENGGLPATPFATKTLMDASELSSGSYALVTNDEVSSNNGLYLKSSSGWTKAKADTKSITEDVVLNSSLSDSTVLHPVFGAVEQGAIITSTGEYRPPHEGNYLTRVRLKKPMKTSVDIPVLIKVPTPNEVLVIYYDSEMQRVNSSPWTPDSVKVIHDGYISFLIRQSSEDGPITPNDAVFSISKDSGSVGLPIMSDEAFGYVDSGDIVSQSTWEQGGINSSNGDDFPDGHLELMRARTRKLFRYSGAIKVVVRKDWACRVMLYDKNGKFVGVEGYFDGVRLVHVDGCFRLVAKYVGPGGSVGSGELEFSASGGIPIFVEPAITEQSLPDSRNLLNKKPMRLRWVRGSISSQDGEFRTLGVSTARISLNTIKDIPTSLAFRYSLESDDVSEFLVYRYGVNGEFLGTNGEFVDKLTLSHDGFIRVAGRLRSQEQMPDLGAVGVYLSVEPSGVASNVGADRANRFLLGGFCGVYRANTVESISSGSSRNLASITYSDIYAEYDALVSAHPDYVKKELLGTDEAGINYYKYIFSSFDVPMSLGSQDKPKKTKVVVTSGVHGNEKNSTWSTLEFFKDLANNDRDDNNLNIIRDNVEIQVFPMVNPKGWAANVRGNTIIDDLNRDFEDFESEEAKLVKGFLDSNDDAIAHIDLHNKGEGEGSFYYTNSDSAINIAGSVFSSLISAWSKDYSLSFEQEAQIIRVYRSNIVGSIRWYAANGAGIENSITIEHPLLKVYFDSVSHGDITIKTSVDVLANTIIAIVKNNTN